MNELALFAGADMKTHWKSSEYAREKAKAWRLANPEKVKEHRIKNRQKNYRQELVRKYGVDFSWFDDQFEWLDIFSVAQASTRTSLCEAHVCRWR